MVGGGSRKDDGSLGISSNNVFAALDSLRKKKKSDSSKIKASAKSQRKEPQQPQVFWAPTPLTAKSWADVDDDDDDDDDDYYATTAPPQPVWGSLEKQDKECSAAVEEDTESDDDGIDDVDVDIEEEHEQEPEVQQVPTEQVRKHPPTSMVPKDTERQLSKKELKKKELAELDAVLAELGISTKDNIASQNETNGAMVDKKTDKNSDVEKMEKASAPSESKNSKKKKKEKSSREVKDLQEQQNATDRDGTDEASAEPLEGSSTVVVVEKLKKLASMKKKKSSKEMDVAAKAASVEAAARSAKLAAARKKEKNHYNQQPVR